MNPLTTPQAEVKITAPPAGQSAKKVVVAVHGIGDQFRYATVQSVAAAFTDYCGHRGRTPLGGFHATPPEVGSWRLFEPTWPPEIPAKLRGTVFAEIYWAGIPREAAQSKDTIEEAKSWAQTVVERVRALDYCKNKEAQIDYDKASTVVAEMIETIRVLENLLFIASKAGMAKFELASLLTDYLGDVQIVTEFADYRARIAEEFDRVMRALSDPRKNPELEEIHIVAHSEGTVVSFLGIMTALTRNSAADKQWTDKLAGYLTIGSPIDKHIVMWPDLWKSFARPEGRERARPIQWRNYYDYGDPVGFELDSARDWLVQNKWKQSAEEIAPNDFFDFTSAHDIGFTRYPFPGKAHNDYWKDGAVFSHFIAEVIEGKPDVARPSTKLLPWIVSWILPYLFCLSLLGFGVYLFYKAVAKFVPGATTEFVFVGKNVVALTFLLAGMTLIARVPRLAKFWPWHIVAGIVFGLSIWGYNSLISNAAANELGGFFYRHFGGNARWDLIAVIALIGLLAATISAWWPRAGLKPLMWMSAALAAIVAHQLINGRLGDATLWPVILAGAAFLYLWWLSALIFDLVFVWHRYIRFSTGNKMLRAMRPAN
ncbi:MAG: MFS transporter [Chthoniobacterales bacterium]